MQRETAEQLEGFLGNARIGRRPRVRIMTWGTANNRANLFTLDLLVDPYWVGTAQPSGVGGRII